MKALSDIIQSVNKSTGMNSLPLLPFSLLSFLKRQRAKWSARRTRKSAVLASESRSGHQQDLFSLVSSSDPRQRL